jgi:hypothetical protein
MKHSSLKNINFIKSYFLACENFMVLLMILMDLVVAEVQEIELFYSAIF